MEALCGAVFRGNLEPPDGEACALTYRFDDAPSPPPMPQAVKRKRQVMRWPWKEDIHCLGARVSIPALGIEGEEVVVSSDPPAKNGSCRLLLQSLKRPELGVTVLILQPGGDELCGGEEDWEPTAPPLIRASRAAISPTTSPKGRTNAAQRQEQEVPHQPTKPQAPPAGSKRPQPAAGREARVATIKEEAAPVVPPGPRIYEDPHDSDTEQEARRAELAVVAAGPVAAIEGGIGRLGMDFAGKPPPRQQAPGPGVAEDGLMRPDAAAGDPDKPRSINDDELRAAEADTAERLVAAVAKGETGDMRLVLARIGPNHAAPPSSKYAGLMPLMVAAERGRDEALELLLEKKADLEAADTKGWTALMHAVQGQRPAIVKRLLDARASANAAATSDERLSALMLAAAGARQEICAALLKANAKREPQDVNGRRAMHVAAQAGRGAQLSLLIAARANLDEADTDGRTPLVAAASNGRAESVKILLAARADPEAKDLEGRSARDLAAVFGHERVLNGLAEAAEQSARRSRR